MDFSTIVSSISGMEIQPIQIADPLRSLWQVTQIKAGEMNLQPGILLVGRMSELDKLDPNLADLNILAQDDAPCPDALIRMRGLNLAGFPARQDMTAFFAAVQEAFSRISRINHGVNILLGALLADLGLQHMAESAAQVFDMSVLITDNSYKHLAWAHAGTHSQASSEQDAPAGYIADEHVREIQVRRIDELIRKSGRPTLVRSSFGEEFLVSPVVLQGIEVAHISVQTGGRAIGEVERELLKQFSRLVANEMQKNSFFKANQGSLHAGFLVDLFENRLDSLIDVRKRLNLMGFSLRPNLFVLVVDLHDQTVADSKWQLIISQLQKLIPESLQMVGQNDAVFLFSRTVPEAYAEENKTLLSTFLRGHRLNAGISSSFSDILDARRHYGQARKAAQFGRTFMPDETLHRYDALRIHHIAELCEDRIPLQDLCHPALGRLRQIDSEQRSCLYATLCTYLDLARSPSRAAAKLGIHRNTLFHRIEKISKLTGISFENGDDILQLSLSIRLLDYQDQINPEH